MKCIVIETSPERVNAKPVTNEDGTPHIYATMSEASAELRANGYSYNRTNQRYYINDTEYRAYILRADSEEYAEIMEQAEQKNSVITLDQFKTATANEYGEAFGLIDLQPNTPAYRLRTNNYLFTIGFADGFNEWVCQIDDSNGDCVACWQGSTPQEALENACIEACSVAAMRENAPCCEDVVNVMGGEAFAMLHDGNYPDTAEDYEQYNHLLSIAANFVIRSGAAYGIEWSAYRVCDEWAEDAANALISAYAEAIGESVEDTDPEYAAAHNVAAEEVASIEGAATERDRAIVDDMVQAIAKRESRIRFDRQVAPYLVWEDEPETQTPENYAAENAALSLINAYAETIGKYPDETGSAYFAAFAVAAEEIAGRQGTATVHYRCIVADMVNAIAEQAETEAAHRAFEARRAEHIGEQLRKYDGMPYLTLIAR